MFRGAGVALVTPFHRDTVDTIGFSRLIDFQLNKGIQALIVLGTTGEATTLTEEERALVITLAVEKAQGQVPVIVGTGSNNTRTAMAFTRQAEALGADGVMVVTPYYNKCTQQGLVQHFEAIAATTQLPLLLYNVPGRTGVNLAPQTVATLSQVENIVGIKEASGNMSHILEIKRLAPPDFLIYSGNDDNISPIYALGGHGVISVMANIIPQETQAMCISTQEEVIDLQIKFKHLINLLFIEVNPIPVKAALFLMGFIDNELRLPLTPIEQPHFLQLQREMKKVGLLP